ncbi:MAG: DNA mismatch repair endonuclease MutL [Clostridia bacterium]|nr:DNA mismatch repair endonuclease MutL [Clostridia bacterium]
MAQITVLSQAVADKIAAGEVVERPAAVVKELVENSIDAGADRINVEIKNGGIKYISVEDNGKGIPADELETAFLRHATSKLSKIEDLFEINTMGFRGEALASICAVSEVSIVSRTRDCDFGMCMSVKHGAVSEKEEVACNIGTLMVVENLFSNVPARMKFLKKDSSEGGYVTDILGRMALAKPDIAFRYTMDGKEVFSTSGDGKLKNAILNIYGIDHAKALCEVDYAEHGVRVYGVVGKAELARGNRTRQTLFVNGRYIKNHVVSKVVEEAYRNILMTGKFPFFVLNIDLSPQLVDVNVHPAKTEIKFANEKEIYNIVHCAVKNAFYKTETKVQEIDKADERTIVRMTERAEINPAVVKEFMEKTIPSVKSSTSLYVFNEPRYDKDLTVDYGKASQENEITFNISDMAKEQKNDTPEVKTEDLIPDILDFAGAETKVCETRVIGQIFDTYIIAQKSDEMFLIDQHAAHERKRFEMLKKDYFEKKTMPQQLLTPIVIDADATEIQAVAENKELLGGMGFLMEEFGRGSLIIRETPFMGDEDDIKNLALEVISALSDNRPVGVLSFEERILDMISCRYAIKANKKLSMLEMEALVRDVEELESLGISTCPHGRPIKLSFSKKEIEKGFKRIV